MDRSIEQHALKQLTPEIIDLAERLSRCQGVIGVVLGGSRARGKQSIGSDFDLGLYYRSGRFEWEAAATVLRDADKNNAPNGLAPPGSWGPWMNGGGWLELGELKVDVLLRDLAFVTEVVERVCNGEFSSHYIPGHPHGWHSFMLAGEAYYNVPIAGDLQELDRLKSKFGDRYPLATKRAIFDRFGYEARFTTNLVRKLEGRNDLAHLRGLSYRALMCLAHVICAVNGTFVVNEKGLIAEAEIQPKTIEGFSSIASELLNTTSATTASDLLEELLDQTVELAQVVCSFTPFWDATSFPHV